MPLTVLPSLEKSWRIYRELVLPKDASEQQVADAKFHFSAGASILFAIVTGALSPGNGVAPSDLDIMVAVTDEMRQFESTFDSEVLRRRSLML